MAALSSCASPLMSTSDYSVKSDNSNKKSISKWTKFFESIENVRNNESSDTDNEKRDTGILDFIWKRETELRGDAPSTSSIKTTRKSTKKLGVASKSLASSPYRLDALKKSPILKCFDITKSNSGRDVKMSPSLDDGLLKFVTSSRKRRSSTPGNMLRLNRSPVFRRSGARTDSENEDVPKRLLSDKRSEILCDTPDNILITRTAPSVERFARCCSSTSDDEFQRHGYDFLFFYLDLLMARRVFPHGSLPQFCLIIRFRESTQRKRYQKRFNHVQDNRILNRFNK